MAEGTRSSARNHDENAAKFSKLEDNQLTLQGLVSEIAGRLHAIEAKLDTPSRARCADSNEEGDASPLMANSAPKRLPTNGGPRPLKLDMPRFHGENPMGWLFKVEQYFSYYEYSEDQRFIIASVNMDGPALSWYQWMHNNKQLTTWSRFKEELLSRFGPSPYRDLYGELSKLHQQTSVQDFYNQFEELANQVTGLPTTFLQSCFESGLRRDISREVRSLRPSSLQQAFQLAKLMEDRLADTPLPPLLTYRQPSNNPPLLPAPNRPPPIPNPPPPLPLHRITTTQMAERKAQGLCFNCNDKYHRGHVCKARLFVLMATNEDYDEPDIAHTVREPEPGDYG